MFISDRFHAIMSCHDVISILIKNFYIEIKPDVFYLPVVCVGKGVVLYGEYSTNYIF